MLFCIVKKNRGLGIVVSDMLLKPLRDDVKGPDSECDPLCDVSLHN